MTSITETFGRGAVIATASNYKSVADALMELIDNPIDKRRRRHLVIDVSIEKAKDRVTITDIGGEGMNDADLQGWIRWGEGEDHDQADIGQYHVGGKLAAIYLAESLEITCRRSGEVAIWGFEDPRWGSRTTALDSSPLAKVNPSSIRWPDSAPPKETGFTQITLRGLNDHRYNVSILRERIADTYRSLITRNECKIYLNGREVETRHIPWSSSIIRFKIPRTKVFKDVYIEGIVGAIDRDQVSDARGARIPAGIRTEFNGRKISDGEEFGFKLSGKGNLQRVYGEIQIQGRGIKPNQLKTGWAQDSEAWGSIEGLMKERMQPIVTALGRLSEARPVTREQKERAKVARSRAEEAFRKLEHEYESTGKSILPSENGSKASTAPEGRKRPETRGGTRTESQGGTKGETKRRTVAPDGAVGRLLRSVGGSGRVPSVTYDALGSPGSRTEWRDNDDSTRAVVINTDYPLYKSLGEQDDYIFDSLVTHLVFTEISEVAEARKTIEQVVCLDREAR